MIIYNPKIAGPSYKQDIKLIIDYYLALNNCVNRYAHELSQCSHDKGHDGGQELCAFYHVTERMNIQHYKPGEGFYAWHHERGEIAMHRELVFMTYLNDVPDGGTEFLYQDLTTTAKKGKTLIWPANYTHIHRGQISKTQEKYIITGVYGSQRILNGKPRWPHYGIDFHAAEGTPVKAMMDGEVTLAENNMYFTGGTIIFDLSLIHI